MSFCRVFLRKSDKDTEKGMSSLWLPSTSMFLSLQELAQLHLHWGRHRPRHERRLCPRLKPSGQKSSLVLPEVDEAVRVSHHRHVLRHPWHRLRVEVVMFSRVKWNLKALNVGWYDNHVKNLRDPSSNFIFAMPKYKEPGYVQLLLQVFLQLYFSGLRF